MPSAPLDNLEMVANAARVRLNDAIANIGGDILTDIQPFTLQYINNAWRRFQELMVSLGVTWFKVEQIFDGVAANTNADPSSQQYINWANFFNGSGLLTAPVLPQNFIAPLVLWERATGPNSFFPMDRLDNGLPAVPKSTYNKSWEWRNGAIYIPGAMQIVDLRIRYAAFLPDFVASTVEPFASQPVPIMRALNPFAWFLASEVAKARGDLDSGYFDQQAQSATAMVFQLDPMQARSVLKESEYSKMTDANSRIQAPSGPQGKQGIQ